MAKPLQARSMIGTGTVHPYIPGVCEHSGCTVIPRAPWWLRLLNRVLSKVQP